MSFLGSGAVSKSTSSSTETASSTATASPAALAKQAGDAQSSFTGKQLALAFSVLVTDASGAPYAGAIVTWVITSGDGTLSSSSSTSDSSGIASTWLTLGSTAGAKTVTATISGTSISVTFTATANAYSNYDDDGAGTAANPFKIHSATQFVDLANTPSAWSKSYVLSGDIDLSSVAGNHPIIGDGGVLDATVINFTGTFDGNGNKIKGFYHHNAAGNAVAPFGNTAAATIKNLTMENLDVLGNLYVGGVIGLSSGSVVSNCSTSGTVTGSQRTGGLVGHLSNSLVINSSSSATVTGGDRTGGLVGRNYGSRISSSYATGDVTGTTITGGLSAEVSGDGDLNNSYATGNVVGTDRTGGLVGFCELCFKVTNNYSTGNVTGTDRTGGLIGHNTGAVSYSFTIGNVTGTVGTANIGPVVGSGNGLTHVYSYASATCDSNRNVAGTQACNATGTGTKALLADFHDPANTPLSGWDFNGTAVDGTNNYWVSGTSYPTLWFQSGSAGTPPWAGDGTPSSPFLIKSEADLNLISHNPRWLGNSFELTTDLDYSVTTFVQVANSRSGFFGTFEGNNHAIRNVTLNTPTDIFTAVFGVLMGDGIIKNLSAENLAITGGMGTAGLVGLLGGDLENVATSGTIISGNANHMVGGVVGWMKSGKVSKSHSTAALQPGGAGGTGTVGGLVGNEEIYAEIETSYFAGTITGTRTTVGGLVGNTAGSIRDSYVTADVVGRADIGGLVGKTSSTTLIERCYTLGNVTSVSSGYRTGGLVGSNSGSVKNSFAIGNISGHTGGTSATVGMLFGTIPGGGTQSGNYYYSSATCDADSSAVGVQACNTTSAGSYGNVSDFYLSTNAPLSTWDFTTVWRANAGAYPTLR